MRIEKAHIPKLSAVPTHRELMFPGGALEFSDLPGGNAREGGVPDPDRSDSTRTPGVLHVGS